MPVALAVCMLALLLQTPAPSPLPPHLYFHHVHVPVGDPASASRDTAAQMNGARTILQGHGISARIGQDYVVFDRDEGQASKDPSAGYQEAMRWLNGHGLTLQPRDFASVSVHDAIRSQRIDVIAFASRDPSPAVEWLARRGVQPVERRDDVARFEISKGLAVEIVRDTEGPETHWCPMHPDIRSTGAVKCSICGMALVPIPPPKIGEYRLDVTVVPGAGARGIGGLRLRVVDPDSQGPVAQFLDVHAKPFHLFIVSRNLEYFAHVHPDQRPDGTFAIDHELPEGEYMLMADFVPAGGTSQMVQRAIVTPHYGGKLFEHSVPALTDREQRVDGLLVRLEADSLRPLRPSNLRFFITEQSGRPVTDLELYLGAPGHLLIVDPDLKLALHGHPEGRSTGPSISFDPVLPLAGRYKLWVQFQRKGKVFTVPFVIAVSEQ